MSLRASYLEHFISDLDDSDGYEWEDHGLEVGLVLFTPLLELLDLPGDLVKLVHDGPGLRNQGPVLFGPVMPHHVPVPLQQTPPAVSSLHLVNAACDVVNTVLSESEKRLSRL